MSNTPRDLLAREAARSVIQARFRETVDSDVSGLAAQHCLDRGLLTPDGQPAARLCVGSHEAVTHLIWHSFAPAWNEVVYVYDGHRAELGRYLHAKLHLTVALAAAGDEATPGVKAALIHAERTLAGLWLAWAGHQATTTDALSFAVSEFDDLHV